MFELLSGVLAANEMDAKLVHFKKALLLMVATLAGMVTDVKLVQP